MYFPANYVSGPKVTYDSGSTLDKQNSGVTSTLDKQEIMSWIGHESLTGQHPQLQNDNSKTVDTELWY